MSKDIEQEARELYEVYKKAWPSAILDFDEIDKFKQRVFIKMTA